jgi:uncharacterized protein with FMN-binding domain
MKRITFWVLSTVSALVLLFGYSTSTSSTLATRSPTTIQSGESGSFASTAGTSTPSTAPATTTPSATPKAGSGSTKRTVTGSTASTQWGPVQVQLTISGGRITKASVLQYPNGNSKDAEINSYALPILTQETVDAQSAGIDMVSGATVTSDGYLQSLQSALDQANL